MKLGTQAHKAALASDDAWHVELVKRFGKRASDARYRAEGKGEPGSALRAAYEARTRAQAVWHKELAVGPDDNRDVW